MSISAIWATAGSSWANSAARTSSSQDLDTAAAQTASVLSSLTSNDRSLIAAAAGVVIAPDGSIESGSTGSGASSLLNDFVFVIAAARKIGSIQGPITPQALQSLFPPYISDSSSTVQQAVANGVSFLSSTGASQQSGLDVRV